MRRRLEKRIYIPLPNQVAREELFRVCLRDTPTADDIDVSRLAELCDGYSGADVSNVCRDAAMMAMRRVMTEARARGLSGSQLRQFMDESEQVRVCMRSCVHSCVPAGLRACVPACVRACVCACVRADLR